MSGSRRRSFTLVEVLLAAAILSVLLVAVSGLLRQTRIFSERVGGREEAQEQALLTLRRLTDDLAEASAVVAPSANADGSPRTEPYVVLRTAEEELVCLYLDPADRTVKRLALPWDGSGTGFSAPVATPLGASPDFRGLLFTVASGPGGSHVRVALETTKDWFFEAVKPWNERW